MTAMASGAATLIREEFEQGHFDGVLGMGGTGGSSVISAAMRTLPVGVPKVLVSTAPSAELAGTRDITMIPSVVDVDVNRDFVAAQWVETLGSMRRRTLERAVVTRIAIVVEDDLAVEIFEPWHW